MPLVARRQASAIRLFYSKQKIRNSVLHKKVTRPECSNGDAGLMTMRALESLMQNMQDTCRIPYSIQRTGCAGTSPE